MAQSAHPFITRLARGPILADGAMGTMLHARGADVERPVEELNLAQPDWVREVHVSYIQAGAEIITSNTFGASRPRLAEAGLAEQLRQINFRGVKLAREAREISGQPVWVAGSLGPLGRRGRHRDGTLKAAVAEAAFREQVSVLWEAGADFLIFETFSDLAELSLGVAAARATCDLPVVAEMTFGNDGNTGLGYGPAEVAHALAGVGVDLAGVNCSMGPAGVLNVLLGMHTAEPRLALSAMPNAGFPYRAGDRVVYLSAPNYFAQHVAPFLTAGAVVIGGCCGTTPAHIRAMRESLDRALAAGTAAAGRAATQAQRDHLPAVPMVRTAGPGSDDLGAAAPESTGLLNKIRSGRFVVSVEVDPPRGFNPTKMLDGARIAAERGADAVNVADSPMARVRMGALALCALIQSQVGIETVLHFTTRDRSLMGVQADLIGAHALGVRNILALTGDPPNLGDQPDSRPVYDVDSIGLVHILKEFNEGNDRSGKPFGSRAGFTIAVACDPTRADLVQEVDRFHRKVSGGAHFTMTQPIFDPATWSAFYTLYEERYGPFPVPVLIGILPLQSHRHASFLDNEVPGIQIPAEALARMEAAGADGRKEGVKMAQELLLQLMALPKVQGVYLMPSFGRYEVACDVLDVIERV
ncbi:MAG TPA: bifunctional homocysteine S-methyltransferase/methylenetetrahydrofolate reductase [Anaerolineae bacterium]